MIEGTHERRGWRAPRTLGLAAWLVLSAACGGIGAPQGDVSTGQLMLELSEAINGLREDNAMLQAQVDSLRGEVARQDSLVRQLAAVAGMPVPPR